jgi:hypothetical protein
MGIGTLAAHSLAYRAVATDGDERRELLEHSGHGYPAYAHLALALCVTLVLVGLVFVVVEARRGRGSRPVPVWLFGVVLSVGFTVQEHVERLVASGNVPVDVLLEPTFVVGLLLQLVFAVVAALVARALLASAEVVGRALTGRRSRRTVDPRTPDTSASTAALAPFPVLALGHGQRAPPLRPSFG